MKPALNRSLARKPSQVFKPVQSTISTIDPAPPDQATKVTVPDVGTKVKKTESQPSQSTSLPKKIESSVAATKPTKVKLDDIDGGIVGSDLWSAAYREAVESMQDEMDITILKGSSVAQLFEKLEEIDKDVNQKSAFVRGMEVLKKAKKPLENFKLALDLASPLAELEPVATTVVGVLKGVTAIAISVASADVKFEDQIVEMLQHISYIDDCDTLGQKADDKDIHKALVVVYKKILEFYKVAFDILTRKGVKLIMKMVMENDRLPSIVQDFLKCADILHKLIEKSVLRITQDIQAMLYHSEITQWLGTDKIRGQSTYHSELQSLRADRAFLGDKGHGKTVAMAYLVDQLNGRNTSQIPQPKLCYYYCRDDETGEAIQILSALILSLLEQLPGLQKPFFEMYKQAQASGNIDPATNIKTMEEFLQKLLKAVDRPMFVLIDGLDECSTESRNDLLKILKTLSQEVPVLKIILSSRPQEEILEQLDKIPRIDLISDIQRDRIIAEATVERQLTNRSTDVKELVIDELSKLAEGSAIWTKMTVNLIKIRKIRMKVPMKRFLETILLPPKLSGLYVEIFSRCTSDDHENEGLARTALKLLAVSRRPLSIVELAWAVTLGVSHGITNVTALTEEVDHQRLMSLIDPFISRTDFSDIKKRQVRLVHQSVKEFIIEKWTSGYRPALAGDRANSEERIVEDLEACMLDICVRYLLLDDIGNRDLFPEEFVAISELPQGSDLFDEDKESVQYDPYCTWDTWEDDMIRYDPTERGFGEFFVYASCHWTGHFGAISANSALFPSLEHLESVCKRGSTRLKNWIEQNRRPICAINPREEFDYTLYDPLSITSLFGSKAMLCYMLENSNFDEEKYLPNPLIGAADQVLQWGDISRLRILFLNYKGDHQLQNLESFRLVIKNWFYPRKRHNNWEVVYDLVDSLTDKMVREHWGNELLCIAARAGCMPIIRRLVTNAQQNVELRSELLRESRGEQQPPAFAEPTRQSIEEAVLGNHVDAVECLLTMKDIEVHLQYQNCCGENVFHLASTICNPAMFRVLVPRYREGVHQVDHQGSTALVRVITNALASEHRYEIAKIIISESSPDWTSHYHDGQQNPLRAAVQLGDLEMCSLLIRDGGMSPVSALSYDKEGRAGLKDRNSTNEDKAGEILQLLSKHADLHPT
ncbi:uncharacterized protein BHQ10_001440 [Talaromyces amestolkiae]|uniref:NACHT domain-containing protein n=1 Tax=Talaromyces amestolkiae TaxID=1196081 RepID=A0A364KPF4_TALAM|nr:uncharacterized protein BHQ10_001440 [Talaromyces amestolkiae]RAO65428.1 hypothetical protein BHQ10_001440 [Talaromyces amestolkiae]